MTKANEPKYSTIQLMGIILVVVFTIYTETTLFKDMPDLTRAGAIIAFVIMCSVFGVKRGSLKDVLTGVKQLLDDPDNNGETLGKIENFVHLLCVKAGMIWDNLLDDDPGKLEKLKKLFKKK